MWGQYGPRPEPNHDLDTLFGSMSAAAEVEVACSPEAAWELISSIERIGEFSPECVDAWWTPDRPARAVGGRFEGRNRVVRGEQVAEHLHVDARTLATRIFPNSSGARPLQGLIRA